MLTTQQKKIALIAGIVILALLIILGIWQLKPDQPATDVIAPPPTLATQPSASAPADAMPVSAVHGPVHGPLPTLAPSLRGTQVDCPLQIDGQGHLVLTVGIRNCFDYFLSSLGEKTETQLIADIRLYMSSTLPATALPYGNKLLDQYIAYMHAKTQQTAPAATGNTPDAYQAIFAAQKDLRMRFFSPAEADAFFGADQAYDQFSIDSMRINADKSLSAQQKAAKVAELINQQPAAVGDSIRPLMQFSELQQLTKEIKARGGSAEELHRMRESLVGPAAANRLDQVDADNTAWQQQVDSYLAAREQIKSTTSDPASQQSAITALRNQTFSSPEQRLRAQSFEVMHDQGVKVPLN